MTTLTAPAVSGMRLERTLLARPGSAPDTTTRVTWLQGNRLYCDLRQPASMPPVPAPSLGAASIDDLLVLATQDGFAGRLLDRRTHVEWERSMAIHPAGPHPDAGALGVLDDTTIVEHGVFEDYLEHWRIAATSPRIEEALLEDLDTGAAAVMVRVGEEFAFARGRVIPLSSLPLDEQIRGARTLRAARELMDCEISVGVIENEVWRITASTLPFRIGALLDLESTGILSTGDIDVVGRAVTRRWRRLDLPEHEPKGMS
ncbi:hypothetical protein [Rhodococcus coprophilus]|uniref:hypothetical protein n=1 Tax=Rhodococcus coprophilus TaxID=38310 RepID=UPI003407EFD3